MDSWGWEYLRPWLELRMRMPVGPLLCVIDGRTRGRPWASDAGAGSRPTSCATPTPSSSPTKGCRSMSSSASWGIPTSASRRFILQGIDNAEIIATVHARKAPMIPASTGLRL